MTNVLVIDDDEMFAETLCEFLEDSGGINIMQRCSSYTEAKSWYGSGHLNHVDAVILDLMLPYTAGEEQNGTKYGLTILEDLRKNHSFEGPIIMLTNSRESEDGRAALDRGCSGYLCKHASADAIPHMVAELKLALTGQVVLVSSALRHLIIHEKSSSTYNSIHRGQLNQVRKNSDPETVLMDLLGQNPEAWAEIKKELGYDGQTIQSGEEPLLLRRLVDRRKTTHEQPAHRPKGDVLYSSGGLVRHLLESAPRAIFITTTDGIIVFVNAAVENMLGKDKNFFLGQTLTALFPELKRTAGSNGGDIEFYATAADGSKFPVSVASSTFEEGTSYGVHIFTDLTSQKITEQKLKALVSKLEESSTRLEQLVKTDPLTGLLNRRGLESVLAREMALARRNRTELIALLIDLDDFKAVNDGHGHAAGDTVLKGVANVLKDTLRTSDWLGRIGGDEFMIFLPSTNLNNGAMIAERIRATVASTSMGRNGKELRATTSVGVVKLPYYVESLEEVLELTKGGLKNSKKSGKNIVSVSADPTVTGSSAVLNYSRNILLDRNGFSVVHQPIFNLFSGRAVAIELFTRGAEGGLRMPNDFFMVAKENKILTEVDLNCLNTCLAFGERCPEDLIVHINLLPSTLSDLPIEQILSMTEQLRRTRRICLELSEKHLMLDPSYLLPKVKVLKEAGILLALDDVGFGCTSLETLTLFEPDCIKIDGAIVNGVSQDQHKHQAVARMVTIASSLHTVPIAEGIENEADLEALQKIGVSHGQGWLWGKKTE